MKTINVDMYQTLAVAVGVLYLGGFLKKKVRFLETFCIPSPVIGGIIFAIISCILHVAGIVEFQFDETLKTVCMVMFFTSVGFQANIKVLKAGGKSLIVFLLCLIVLIFAQNAVAVGLSKLLGVSSLVGMCTGSIPMVGGHGTSGAFGTVLEDLGQQGATSLCTAAATFGLIIGSVMGGPIGRKLILKHDLLKTVIPEDDSILVEDEQKHHRSVSMYAPAAYQLAIAMGIGTFVLNCVLFSIAILNILSVNPYATNKIINILANIIITIIGILYFLSVLFSSCFTGFSDSLFIVLVPDASPK